MIECTNCETAQFLQITQSRVFFEDGELINEIMETYQCTLCDSTGQYTYSEDAEDPIVDGSIQVTGERPKYA
ncbi:hypothetical protein ACFQMM_19865 [Saliphagus sp. GCM10025308]|uniref:Uncharacterized protein n=1 Tax=Natronosalvus rutilus TaxID=2953753 RepID=A0A9E7SVN0_9EURY|nr:MULTISPECIES: hypothetical protein [Natronosalvus]UTF53171.1 hypothetical protein NGM29_15560 [Natronosalvus rutilus]